MEGITVIAKVSAVLSKLHFHILGGVVSFCLIAPLGDFIFSQLSGSSDFWDNRDVETKFPHYISHFGYSIFCSLKKICTLIWKMLVL